MLADQLISDAMSAILRRNGLSGPSGRPLYSLQCRDDEFALLQRVIHRVAAVRVLRYSVECAAFCLFAAEWIRRNHREGSITWDAILAGVGLDGASRSEHLAKVREYTRDGLHWWQRLLIRLPNQTRYLTTLACEGGLPLHLLTNHQGTLRRYFRAVLRNHERYPQEPVLSLAEQYDGLLRASLQNEVVHSLAVELVLAVAKLRSHLAAHSDDGADPLLRLDADDPNWRAKLPLRLDDEIARELLRGLLGERTVGGEDEGIPAVQTVLERSDDNYTLRRSFACPRQLKPDIFSQLLATRGRLPSRVHLFLQAGNLRLSAATAALSSDGDAYRIELRENVSFGSASVMQTVRLVAFQGARQLGSCDLVGGEPLTDGPWIFEDAGTDETHRLLGVGSVRATGTSLLLALDSDAPQFLSPSAVERIGTIGELRRCVFRVTGDAELSHDGAVIRLRTRASADENSTFSLRGKRASLGPGGTEVWLGLPAVRENGSLASDVSRQELQWRPATPGTSWRAVSDACLGDVFLCLTRNGELLWKQRVIIFPPEFSVALSGGPSRDEGRLEFRGTRAARMNAVETSDLETDIRDDHDGFVVRVRRLRGLAPDLKLRVQFGSETWAEVCAACPAPGVLVVDAAGRVCATDAALPLELLPRLRLQAVFPDATRPVVLDGEGSQLAPLRQADKELHAYELPLSLLHERVAGMLATLDDPHAWIELRVRGNPQKREGETRLRVCRHAGDLRLDTGDPDCVAAEAPAAALAQPWFSTGARFELNAIGAPDENAPPGSVVEAGRGKWRLDMTRCPVGTWLVTIWGESGVCLHPRTVAGRMRILVDAADAANGLSNSGFARAAEVAKAGDRLIAWSDLVQHLAEHPNDPEWRRMDALLQAITRLPVTTFDAIRALVAHPPAAAVAGIRHARSTKIWQRLQQLSFLWATIGVRTWARAWSLYWRPITEAAQQLGEMTTDVQRDMSRHQQETIHELRFRAPGMAGVVACMQAARLMPIGADLGRLANPSLVAEAGRTVADLRRGVVTGHGEGEHWPNIPLTVTDALRPYLRQLELWECPAYQRAVLHAPVVAAWHAAMDQAVAPQAVKDFHRLRGFDPEWFDRAHELAMFLIAGARLKQNPDCYQP